MKNKLTFEREYANLKSLFTTRSFETAENLVTRMLKDYNVFDYDLLLKRARIRQCLMRYEDALVDSSLALSVSPELSDAYLVVSDCLIATQRLSEAAKLLEIMHLKEPNN